MEGSGHSSIHGDFDAVHTSPKTTILTPTTSGPDTAVKARSAQDLNGDTPPGLTPALRKFSLTSPASTANRPSSSPILPSPLSGATKRHLASEPSPLAQDAKRQRMIPPGPANPLQAVTAATPSHHLEKQGSQSLPVTLADTALGSSRNGPIAVDRVRVGVRPIKGAGLRIDTQAAEFPVRLLPRTEPTHEEELYADYVRTHKVLRGELDNLSHELCAANERANTAELRARKAENMRYQANVASFQMLKELEDKHRIDTREQRCGHNMLQKQLEQQLRDCTVLQTRCRTKDRIIAHLRRQLEQERERER